jgi:hypothetical protein
MAQKDRFSNLKGSLGFAFADDKNFAHSTAVEQHKKQNMK